MHQGESKLIKSSVAVASGTGGVALSGESRHIRSTDSRRAVFGEGLAGSPKKSASGSAAAGADVMTGARTGASTGARTGVGAATGTSVGAIGVADGVFSVVTAVATGKVFEAVGADGS